MAKLNFPDPNSTQTYTEAGITWTWNATLGVWSSDSGDSFNQTDGDQRYLRIDAGASNQTRVAGEATFAELTTHDSGVEISGGDFISAGQVDVDPKITTTAAHNLQISTGQRGDGLNNSISFVQNGVTQASVNALGRFKNNLESKLIGGTCIGFESDGAIASGVGTVEIYPYRSNFSIAADNSHRTADGYGFYATTTAGLSDQGNSSQARRLGSYAGFAVSGVSNAGDTTYGFYTDIDGNVSGVDAYAFFSANNAKSYFGGVTEHKGGVLVTGGDAATANIYQTGAKYLQFGGNNRTVATFAVDVNNVGNGITFGDTTCQLSTTESDINLVKVVYKNGGHGGGQNLALVNSSVEVNTDAQLVHLYQADAGAQQSGKLYGFYSGVDATDSTDEAYNFYAAGNAPNYFDGLTEHVGGVVTDTVRSRSAQATGVNILASNLIEGTTGSRTLQVTWNTAADLSKACNNIVSNFDAVTTSTADVAHYATSTTTKQNTSGLFIAYKANNSIGDNEGSGQVYNFYAAGTAPNLFAGDVILGSVKNAAGLGTDANGKIIATAGGGLGSDYLRKNATDSYSNGRLSIDSHSSSGHYWGAGLSFNNGNWRHTGTDSWGFVFRNSAGSFDIYSAQEGGSDGSVASYRTLSIGGSTSSLTYDGNKVWHEGNDGSGSGLDADTLRGAAPATAKTPDTIVRRDGSGNINAENFNGTATRATRIIRTGVTASNTGSFRILFGEGNNNADGSNAYVVTDATHLTYQPSTKRIANVDSISGKADNAGKLNGATEATQATASTIAKRDSNGDLTANQFKGTAAKADLPFMHGLNNGEDRVIVCSGDDSEADGQYRRLKRSPTAATMSGDGSFKNVKNITMSGTINGFQIVSQTKIKSGGSNTAMAFVSANGKFNFRDAGDTANTGQIQAANVTFRSLSRITGDETDPANFDVDGEYIGPVQDLISIIETLQQQKADLEARLAALEANEIIDDSVDSSLLSLVASLNDRVTALETP